MGYGIELVRDLDMKTFTALRLEQLFESWQSENHLTTAQLIAMSGTPFADRCAELEKHLSHGLIQSWKQAERFCDLAWDVRCQTEAGTGGDGDWFEMVQFLQKAGLLDRASSPNNHRWLESSKWIFRRPAPSPPTSRCLSTVV